MSFSSVSKALLVISSLASAFLAYHYLPKALNLFDISITMNRQQAIENSEKIISEKNLLPSGYNHATYFDNESMLQYYIELAAGGKETFKELLRTHMIEPYKWVVRWYKEGMVPEVVVAFTPEGIPYSFDKRMAETEQAPNLSEEEARALAEKEAATYWNIDFSLYKPFEYSKQEHPSKRIDHTFTYQKENVSLGEEGKYRVKLVVSGDTVTQVSPFVFIPESFFRRYREMRSENGTLATIAFFFYKLFYILGGCLIGVWLFYRRYLTTKYAFIVGIIVAFLTLGASLSEWPFLFINYNTALSTNSVLLVYGLNCIITIIRTFIFISLCAAICISLDKITFPSHESPWSFFSLRNMGRKKMLWYVIGAYLAVTIKFALVTGIYLILTGSYFKWWAPASTLVDPNILVYYVPWLAPFINSFKAGFSEELMCRALPLAMAQRLGKYIKREKLVMGVALVLQAFIFTTLHAYYTTYPAYFRVVEILPAALGYGFIYVRWGLIPAIILHWMYDLVLMGLPIFVSTAPGMLFNKMVLIMLASMPLLFAMYARYRTAHLSEEELNKEQEDRYPHKEAKEEKIDLTQVLATDYTQGKSLVPSLNKYSKKIGCIVLGIITGLILYKAYFSLPYDYMQTPTATAKQICKDAYTRLQSLNSEFAQHATQLYCLESHTNSARPHSSFIWRTETPQTFFNLVDNYIYPITWTVRYARFKGTQVERAEEYVFTYTKDGQLICCEHLISDQIKGGSLSREEAVKRSTEIIEKNYGLSVSSLKEIKCEFVQKPSRTDWVLIFEDLSHSLKQGNTFIRIEWAGEEIKYLSRYIFMPETWNRALDQESLYVKVASFMFYVLLYIIVMMGIYYLRSSFSQLFNIHTGSKVIAFLLLSRIVWEIVSFSTVTYHFSTTMSWSNQLISHIMPTLVSSLIMSIGIGMGFLCYNYSWQISLKKHTNTLLTSLCSAFMLICMKGIIERYVPRHFPFLGDPTLLNCNYTFLGLLYYYIGGIVISLVVIYFAFMGLNKFTVYGTRYRLCVPFMIMIIMTYSLGLGTFSTFDLLPFLIAIGAIGMIGTGMYYVSIRYDFFTFMQGYILFFIVNTINNTYWYISPLLTVGILIIGLVYRKRVRTLLLLKYT